MQDEVERIAAGPSQATLRMAKILGVRWQYRPKWKRAHLQEKTP